ncbi:RagB/SusD family nutrient uptake outer membrane protein [Niabella sp. W65]|nr:RagB/SusD family nutrient uptake outer membrane protein [Niabella sp. W65]MCH7364084.1 RagB/SusD family nutrient uptake outer membrane protein [Niabella sp. W65]ULT46486.1 RagB/SusD family nutrient uptake outer membrane protein [Niabella sp. I65]
MYFYLVNLFGDAPLITSTDYEKNTMKGRDNVMDVYSQIKSDLEEAEGLMNDTYVTPSRVRPNLKTVQALLARVYLYTEQWDLALAKSSAIIESGLYSIEPLNNVFTIESKETIWQLMPVQPSWNTTEARQLLPTSTSASALGQMAMTEDLYNSFSTTDARRTQYVLSKTVGGNIYRFAQKYKAVAIGTVSEYYKVFRLAEQYLIRAEANAKLNNNQAALNDVNIIRERAGLVRITEQPENILRLIEIERRLELFAEWGHRWFDLKRIGRALDVLKLKQPDIQALDLLYPIPNSVLRANPFIKQNQGYE